MDTPDPPPAAIPSPPDPLSVVLPLADEVSPTPLDTAPPTAEPLPLPLSGADSPPAPAAPPPHPHASPYRLLASVMVGFVCFFLLVRVIAVEPFGVPTGSMAPALIGNHREGPCPRCGHPVRVGAPSVGYPADHYASVACPNCLKRFSLADAIDLNGDRLLVDKNVYNLRRPRRWEMAVFHCPDPNPKEFRRPYVKRVLGLPGESITIVEGDGYANGELLRKGLTELRETRVVVFELAHSPRPDGWGVRFLVEPAENDPRLPPASNKRPEPADSSVVRDGELVLDAAASPQATAAVTYRNWNLDDRREDPVRAWSSYDGVPRAFNQLPPANDFSVSCEVEVVSASGEASFACRLTDGADSVYAEVSVGARADGLAVLGHDGKGTLGSFRGVSLETGRKHRVEFSFVDRRVILAIDGRIVVPPADLLAAAKRPEVRRPLQFGARGCRLIVRNLKLYRDTYYTQFGENGTVGEDGKPNPALLGPDEYFMVGDNSGNSQDSRKWPRPGVPEAEFIGKPFLIHQPLRPARVSVGGRERVFQTVDWSRLRWLH